MAGTAELISELGRTQQQPAPTGFRYQEDVITATEETALVAALQKLNLKPFEFHGLPG
jgi:hypothetical protein